MVEMGRIVGREETWPKSKKEELNAVDEADQ